MDGGRVKYQLFTNQYPTKKLIGPFNIDEIMYCDLVKIICNQERNELGEDMTVELYTCEGYPLATRPISYISKLSDWCLEEYPDTPLLYAVPRLKCYTDKCIQYMTAAPLCDGIDHIFIRNDQYNFIKTMRTDCSQATYLQLIRTIQEMTGIPGHLIQLFKTNELISSDEENLTLDKVRIYDQSTLDMKLKSHFWSLGKNKNFSLQECRPTWHLEQTTFGTSLFFSCLYSLADWMAEANQKSSGVLHRTLGHIRSITGCPPLIHALNILFSKETLTLPHRVAIQECLVLLFKTIISEDKELHTEFEKIDGNKVTELSNYLWVYLIYYSKKIHLKTEKYSTLDLTCSVTFKRITDPVEVRDVNGLKHIVDRNTLYEEDRKKLGKSLHNYKRMINSFIEDEAIVWNCITAPTCRIDIKDKWANVYELCSISFPALCIQIPENINATSPRPSMIPLENGNIGVYIGKSRNILKPFIYYDVLTGKSLNFDVQKLDLAVKMNPPLFPYPFQNIVRLFDNKKSLQAITCEPEEIIMIILETSKSMESSYFDGKTKLNLVLKAFLSFCNCTWAHHLNHIIGLTLFAQNCILLYEFSENFQCFTTKFEKYPLQDTNAIYDAVTFAVEQLNNFTATYPNYKNLPRRILCLTSGEDNNSKNTPQKATRLLIENGIKMDCVLFCENLRDTHAIAKASGGYSFRPANSQEMLSIFEQETLLSMKCRQYSNPSFYPRVGALFSIPFDSEPSHILPERLSVKVQPAHRYLSAVFIQKQLNTSSNTNLTKRILQELSYYQAHPHPAFEVFPGEEHIDFWRIIMEGPEDTPYEGGIFELFIEFINEYPSKPPNIRFITPIYHCNINSSGRICHSILDRFYVPGVRVGEIFNYVYGLLSNPDHQYPLDSVKAYLLYFDEEKYNHEAKEYTKSHANVLKTTVRNTLLGEKENLCVSHPEDLVCRLTLQLFKDPVSTLSGKNYERMAILEHLKSGKNYDPFTFRELHVDELRPNAMLKRLVSEYKNQD